MAFTEDLSVFLDDDDFAVTATLNGTASGNVIVDLDYLRAVGMVASADPVAFASAADYGTSCLDGTLIAAGGTYVIRDRQLQEDGAFALLQLETQ